MNIFEKFSFLLIICYIIQLKCSEEEKKEFELEECYYEIYNKSEKIEFINNTNSSDEDNRSNDITSENAYEISEKIYFGKIKNYKKKIFRNFPTENGTNFCFNCTNIKNNTTFIKIEGNNFKPWPSKENNDIEFISVIDFEFDEKGNIYILDEGDINKPIKLYKSNTEFTNIDNYTILSNKTVNVTNFVIDTKKDYIYIAYYSYNNENDIELGIIFKDLKGPGDSITKVVPLEVEKIKDDNYELPQHFMDNKLNNIKKKILSLALSCDSEVLFFCPLSSRKIYSVLTEKIKSCNKGLSNDDINEAYKNDASSSLISSNLGNLYLTGIEKNNTIYIAGQIENDLTIFNYKGIDKRTNDKGNMHTQTDLSIEDGNLYIISKHIIDDNNDTSFILVTEIYKTSIDREKSYVYKCAGLAYKWDFKSYIIWGIFSLIVCFVLVFVFVGNKEDEDINKKNN